MKIFIRNLFAAFLAYIGLLLILFIFQRDILYVPSGKINTSLLPDNFEEIYLTTDDGTKIYSWYKEAFKDQKTIIYFQGNSGNISGRSNKLSNFANAGYGVLAISYRGYPGSEGISTQSGLILDGKSAIDFLKDKKGLNNRDIILYGESLGTGVAMQLAPDYNFYMIVLESPFSSVQSVAQSQYWYAPVSLLLKDKFNSLSQVDKISSPILIFHGLKDKVVDYSEAKELYHKISSPKKLLSDQFAGHVDFKTSFILDELKNFSGEINEL